MPKSYHKRIPNCKCLVCGTPTYKRPQQLMSGRYFCSRDCYNTSRPKGVKLCPVCNDPLPTKNCITCSRRCANMNRRGISYKIGQPRNNKKIIDDLKKKLFILRGPKCERCPHDNLNVLQAHHIIPVHKGGKDEISNLEILCPNCHGAEHYGDSRIQNEKIK